MYRRLIKTMYIASLALSVALFIFMLYIPPPSHLPYPGARVLSCRPNEFVPMILLEDNGNLDEVTVVTAFVHIGNFVKGPARINVTKETYLDWMDAYRYLTNPLVVFTDTPEVRDWFIKNRSKSNTKVVWIRQEDIWPFQYLNKIKEIYSDPNYPKHHPNTVISRYPCSQHAKYSFVKGAIESNYFQTEYFMWTDLGYFRGIVGREKQFRLSLPPYFNKNEVSYNFVNSTSLEYTPDYIFRNNIVRDGGGCFVGGKETLIAFIDFYMLSFERFLHQNLTNTDQQVLYSMFTAGQRRLYPPPVLIQEYESVYRKGDWFYLGYLCLREQNTASHMSLCK